MNKIINIFIIIPFIYSCNSLNLQEYDAWLKENKSNLESELQCNNIKFKMEYVPVEFNKIKKSIEDESDLKEEFILNIDLPDYHNIKSEPEVLFNYTELFMPEELLLIQGVDTINCLSTILESGLPNSEAYFKIIVLFNGKLKQNSDKVSIEYQDNLFNCNQVLKFDFSKLNISKLPKIKK